jgi:hypothetical protein
MMASTVAFGRDQFVEASWPPAQGSVQGGDEAMLDHEMGSVHQNGGTP